MAVKAKPDGYHTVTPYLIVNGATQLVEFLKQAFGATERGIMGPPGGPIMHGEVQIGDSIIMLSDGAGTVESQPTRSMIHLYVDDVDADVQAGDRGRGEVPAGARGPVLRRPKRGSSRCVREPVVPGDACRGCFGGGDGEADGCARSARVGARRLSGGCCGWWVGVDPG